MIDYGKGRVRWGGATAQMANAWFARRCHASHRTAAASWGQ